MHSYTFKTILLGDTGVGKTTLCNTLLRRQNRDMQYQPTIGIDFNSIVETIFNNTTVKVHLWDTAGQEKYRCIIKSYYRGTGAAILMYDTTNESSFNHLAFWLREFQNGTNCNHPYAHPILLLGTKTDMENRRKITYDQGLSFALKHDLIFREVNNYVRGGGVEEGFIEFLRAIYNRVEDDRRGYHIPKATPYTDSLSIEPLILTESTPTLLCKGVQIGSNSHIGGFNIGEEDVKSPSVCAKCDGK